LSKSAGQESGGDPARRVAIACQGGGTRTAFTAGVLTALLPQLPMAGYQVAALSGSAGGAICALLAWSALVLERRGGELEHSLRALEGFWTDNAARMPWEHAWNDWWMALQSLHTNGTVPELRLSPHAPAAAAVAEMLSRSAPRPEFFDLRKLLQMHVPAELLGQRVGEPRLLVSAVDVLNGELRVFDSLAGDISLEAILASSALPSLFPAQRVGDGLYWDGQLSQNPPVHDLVSVPSELPKPDELWVIPVNVRERPTEPKALQEIEDRRSELAGNLSLYQELRFIENVNRWLATGCMASPGHKQITVRMIEMVPQPWDALGYASKLNRCPSLLARLYQHGLARGKHFAEGLPAAPAGQQGTWAPSHATPSLGSP